MKKLWLDDERVAPTGWITAKTAGQAVIMMSVHNVAEVSLDHDLGDDSLFGTGYDVVCWIEEMAHTDPTFAIPVVHVHTANASARSKMKQAVASIERIKASRASD